MITTSNGGKTGLRPRRSRVQRQARPLLSILVSTCIGLTLSACGSGPTSNASNGCGSTLTIGVHNTTSGPSGPYGDSESQGINLWAKDVNAKGGILGAKVTLVERDDAADASQSASVAREFVQKGIQIVQGPLGPVSGPTAAPIYAASNVFALAAVAGGPSVESSATPTSFTLGASRTAQAQFIVNYIKSKGWTNVGLIYSVDGFGTPFSQNFENAASGLKVTVQQMTSSDTDATPQLNKLKAAGAQALVLFILLTPNITTVLSGLDSIKWTLPIVGPVVVGGAQWSLHPDLAKLAGYAQYSWALTGTSAQATDVAQRLGTVSHPDQAIAAYADGVLFEQAIQMAGSCDSTKVMAAVRNFTGSILGVPVSFPASAPNRYGGEPTSLKMAKVGVLEGNQGVPLS